MNSISDTRPEEELEQSTSSFRGSNADASRNVEKEDVSHSHSDDKAYMKQLDEWESSFQNELSEIQREFEQITTDNGSVNIPEVPLHIRRRSERFGDGATPADNAREGEESRSLVKADSGSFVTKGSTGSNNDNDYNPEGHATPEDGPLFLETEYEDEYQDVLAHYMHDSASQLQQLVVDKTPESFSTDRFSDHVVEDVADRPKQEEPQRICCQLSDTMLIVFILIGLGMAALAIFAVIRILLLDRNDKSYHEKQVIAARTKFIEYLPNHTQESIRSNSLSPQSQALQWMYQDPNFAEITLQQQLRRYALATLYYSTSGNNWTNHNNWMSYDSHECAWMGVICEETSTTNIWDDDDVVSGENTAASFRQKSNIFDNTKHVDHPSLRRRELQGNNTVTRLNLASQSLYGSLPAEVAFLRDVRSIKLNNNTLLGSIPQQLYAAWDRLESCEIQYNVLSGSIISDIGMWLQLTTLRVFHNRLSGPISSQFGRLHRLKQLEMDNNNFGGPIPSQLGALTNLQELLLNNNNLLGSIPSELGNLSNLEILGLSENQLTSTIPAELSRLTSLQGLWLYSNSLTGVVNTAFEILAKDYSLEHMIVYGNNLDGTIPPGLCGLAGIQVGCPDKDGRQGLCGCDCPCLYNGTMVALNETSQGTTTLINGTQKLYQNSSSLTGAFPPTLTPSFVPVNGSTAAQEITTGNPTVASPTAPSYIPPATTLAPTGILSPTVKPSTLDTTTDRPTVALATDVPSSAPTLPITEAPATLDATGATEIPKEVTERPKPSPTHAPTASPTEPPTASLTEAPTAGPTKPLTDSPTESPTRSPTESPTASPTEAVTSSPTKLPTASPTKTPTASPTKTATESPTKSPTISPTKAPTASPTKNPTNSPTKAPTTDSPTKSPTIAPTTVAPTLSQTTSVLTLPPTTAATFDPDGCLDNEQEIHVNVDLQIDFGGNNNAALGCVGNQDEVIAATIASSMTEAFPVTVADWTGQVVFGPFGFDSDQRVSSARRSLQQDQDVPEKSCSSREILPDCTADICRWGCLATQVTNCGTSALTNWARLADDIRTSLASLQLDCLGIQEELNVVLLLDEPEELNVTFPVV